MQTKFLLTNEKEGTFLATEIDQIPQGLYSVQGLPHTSILVKDDTVIMVSGFDMVINDELLEQLESGKVGVQTYTTSKNAEEYLLKDLKEKFMPSWSR